MGERLLCKQEVIGSIPFTSTMNPTGSWCVGGAATGTGKARHDSERTRGGAAARRLILHLALTLLARRSWKHSLPAMRLHCRCVL